MVRAISPHWTPAKPSPLSHRSMMHRDVPNWGHPFCSNFGKRQKNPFCSDACDVSMVTVEKQDEKQRVAERELRLEVE